MYRKIPVARPFIDDDDRKVVMEVLNSNTLALGPKILEFEKNMSSYIGVKYGCAVSSGTTGLHLAIRALDIKDGDEVITTPYSFVASSNCILYERARPVFVDIEPVTYNMDPAKIEAAITKKTKAILVVHIFGQTADMDSIMRIAKKHNLKVIEDACESLGAMYKGKSAGSFGDLAVFAFYPNKQMTTGEGGVIVTNSREYVDVCRSLGNQGRSLGDEWLVHERLGYNYRMDEMSAALGITQLAKLDEMIRKRVEIAEEYNQLLSGINGLVLPKVGTYRTHTWFLYVIRVNKGSRDRLMDYLRIRGVQTRPYMPSIHLQPFMKEMFGFQVGDFPVSEEASSQTLALPFYIGLEGEDLRYVVEGVKSYFNHEEF